MPIEADQVHGGADLQIWRRKHPSLEASSSERPSFLSPHTPVLAEKVVISRAFETGLGILLAAWKATGEVAWTCTKESVWGLRTTAEKVYVSSAGSFDCLDAATGEVHWHISEVARRPHSSIALSGGRLFFWGRPFRDFWGRPALESDNPFPVTCTDGATGALLWRTPRPGCVPTAPLALAGKVIANEKSVVFALDALDGRLLWTHDTGSRISRRLLAGLGGVLVKFADGIRLLRSEDGRTVAEWSWPERLIGYVAAGRNQAFAVRSVPTDVIFGGRRRVIPGESEIVQLRADGSVGWSLETWPMASKLAWNERSGWLFETGENGVGLIDVAAGRRRHLISMVEAMTPSGLAVEGDRVYLSNVLGGEIFCLRVPI